MIDATGRREEALRWLEALGLPAPPVESVGVDFGYSSFVLELDATQQRDWRMLAMGNLPRVGARGAVILPIEGGASCARSVVAPATIRPDEREAVLEFAASLPHQIDGRDAAPRKLRLADRAHDLSRQSLQAL